MISVMPRILKDDPTAQEFVNELNIAEDYKEPAKRKYNEKSFYFNAFCRLFFCLKIDVSKCPRSSFVLIICILSSFFVPNFEDRTAFSPHKKYSRRKNHIFGRNEY